MDARFFDSKDTEPRRFNAWSAVTSLPSLKPSCVPANDDCLLRAGGASAMFGVPVCGEEGEGAMKENPQSYCGLQLCNYATLQLCTWYFEEEGKGGREERTMRLAYVARFIHAGAAASTRATRLHTAHHMLTILHFVNSHQIYRDIRERESF